MFVSSRKTGSYNLQQTEAREEFPNLMKVQVGSKKGLQSHHTQCSSRPCLFEAQASISISEHSLHLILPLTLLMLQLLLLVTSPLGRRCFHCRSRRVNTRHLWWHCHALIADCWSRLEYVESDLHSRGYCHRKVCTFSLWLINGTHTVGCPLILQWHAV